MMLHVAPATFARRITDCLHRARQDRINVVRTNPCDCRIHCPGHPLMLRRRCSNDRGSCPARRRRSRSARTARAGASRCRFWSSSARLLIERHLGLAWVSGEISNFTPRRVGTLLFQAQGRAGAGALRAVPAQGAARSDFALQDGSRSRCARRRRSTRRAASSSSTSRRCASPASARCYEQFERLKARLEAAGWFAAERKRPLPAFPRAVGIVTSPRAAALSRRADHAAPAAGRRCR